MDHSWTFEAGKQKPAEQWARKGKPEWPDGLMLAMDRQRALRLISELAKGLESTNTEIVVTLAGTLTENKD